MKMQIIDLFSGIGGFSLTGHWLKWETIQFVELNEFCQKVLAYHFPGVAIHGDIKTLDYGPIKKRIDPEKQTIIVGGFPCQPWSNAGKRLGKEDDRHLWPYCVKAVRAIRPDFCLFENVRGITNWSKGMVFDEVQADLETEGYEVLPFLLPACAVGAPHRRDRIWIIAHSNRRGRPEHELQAGRHLLEEGAAAAGLNPYTTDFGIQGGRTVGQQEPKTHAGQGLSLCGNAGTNWNEWPTQPAIRSRNDGVPTRLAGITVSKHRTESIKAYGNAIVPQLALQIYKAIEMYQRESLFFTA